MRASGAVGPRNHGLRLPGSDSRSPSMAPGSRSSPSTMAASSRLGSASSLVPRGVSCGVDSDVGARFGIVVARASYRLVDSRERCPCARLVPLAPGTTPYGCLDLARGRRPWLPDPDPRRPQWLPRAVWGQRPRLYREASPAVSTRMSRRGFGVVGFGVSYRLVDSRDRAVCARSGPFAPGTTACACLDLTPVAILGSRHLTLAVHNGCLEPSGVSVLAGTERRLLRCRPGCRCEVRRLLIAWSTRVSAAESTGNETPYSRSVPKHFARR